MRSRVATLSLHPRAGNACGFAALLLLWATAGPAAVPAGLDSNEQTASLPALRDFDAAIRQGEAGAAFRQIVFAVRQPKGPHWYENFGHSIVSEDQTNYGRGGRLCLLDCQTGEVTVLIDDPDGAVRDPQVHYGAAKILFSYRRGGSPYFHLYEMSIDNGKLVQLTDGPFDDLEPCYLPEGGIVFCSSRCQRYVPCWYVPVATLYRCEGDGQNIRALSSNIEQDNTPWVLPDGRILYTRWEYVDRSREHFHHLWTMNPDGTGQMTYFGNMVPGDVFLDAKPIPGTDQILMINSPNHGRQEHEGRLVRVDARRGPDQDKAQQFVLSENANRDPYPLSQSAFLLAREDRLLWVNAQNQAREIYRLSGNLAGDGNWLHEPRPLRTRLKEPVMASQRGQANPAGTMIVMDVYHGRNMQGVERGAIKKLLLLENLPKPVNYTGSMDPISYGGSYTLNRVLGTVPVEPDGSVHARVPPLRSLQLVALDANDLSVKRMLSFFTVMPGETVSCMGCHEERNTVRNHPQSPRALRRPPSEIKSIDGAPEVFDYCRDIQPIWDRHCLPCHDVKEYAGHTLLTGDQGPVFTHSYFSLSARLQMADGRDLARGNYAPYTIGSAASYLMNKLRKSHYDVNLPPQEIRLIQLWIDASATFPGTYAALGSGMLGPYAALQYGTKPKVDFLSWPGMRRARAAVEKKCAGCHRDERKLPDSPADLLGLRLHHLKYGDGEPRFWTPPWLETTAEHELRPGSTEWMKKHADPRLQFSRNIVYNLSRPEKSLLLLAPLSPAAGGHGTCGHIFENTNDPGYLDILAAIQEAQAHLNKITRFNMPNFRPEPEYIREMKRYGILPANQARHDPIDVYETDRRYWQSFWHRPVMGRN